MPALRALTFLAAAKPRGLAAALLVALAACFHRDDALNVRATGGLGAAPMAPTPPTASTASTASMAPMAPAAPTPPATGRVGAAPKPFTAAEAERAGWPAGYVPERVRETASVEIDGVIETWKLVWATPPRPWCMDEADVVTGPCVDVGWGEVGELELWRERPGAAREVRDLTGFGHTEGDERRIALAHFEGVSAFTAEGLRAAKPVRIMNVGDYNRDGLAAEFVLPGAYEAYGHRQTFVVGVTRQNPSLHGLGSARDDGPVVLQSKGAWERLRKASSRIEIVLYACGDHGSDVERVIDFTIGPGGLDGHAKSYACDFTREPPRAGKAFDVEPI